MGKNENKLEYSSAKATEDKELENIARRMIACCESRSQDTCGGCDFLKQCGKFSAIPSECSVEELVEELKEKVIR